MHGAARRSALLVACCLSLAGCGATGSTPRHDRPPRPTATNDAAGRAQLVPAAQRIDAGGDPDLQPLVLAANSAIAAEYPGMFVTPEQTAYGRDVWGLCLGSTEVAAFRTATHPVGRLGCEKTGINVLSVPLAEGVELSVGSRAAMRPEVRRYVDLTLTGVAARSAALVDRRPLSAARLAASRATFRRFAAEERAAGTVPIIG